MRASKQSIHQPDDVLEGESPSKILAEKDRRTQLLNRSKSGDRNAKRQRGDSGGASMEFDGQQMAVSKMRSKSNNKIYMGGDD